MVLKGPNSTPVNAVTPGRLVPCCKGRRNKKREPGIGSNSFYPIPGSVNACRGYRRTKVLTPFSPQGPCRLKILATHNSDRFAVVYHRPSGPPAPQTTIGQAEPRTPTQPQQSFQNQERPQRRRSPASHLSQGEPFCSTVPCKQGRRVQPGCYPTL